MLVSGCADENACNYNPLAIPEANSCCYANCGSMNMFGLGGTGWNGALYTISNAEDNEVMVTGDLESAEDGDGFNNGFDEWCLEAGCYYIEVGGGDFDEQISWILLGVNGVVAGEATEGPVYFSVGDAVCSSCQEPLACNYNPDAVISDCTLCEFSSCLGCANDWAINYDPLALIDDGSCIVDLIVSCPFDTDDNGQIDTLDLLAFLSVFGTLCN